MGNKMRDSSHKGYPKIISIIFILVVFVYIYPPVVLAASELSELQREARANRSEGLRYQNAGDLTTAATFYQRAIEIDPFYSVAYNDLGIISEAQGASARAKELYLKAIEIEPGFLSAYANLALLYEQERDLNKAVYYWGKRVEFGSPGDPWTIKAERRLADINQVLSATPEKAVGQQEVIRLSRQVQAEKALLSGSDNKKSPKALARQYITKAKRLYKQGKELEAFRMASNASQLDPSNSEIEEFMNKIATRMLSR